MTKAEILDEVIRLLKEDKRITEVSIFFMSKKQYELPNPYSDEPLFKGKPYSETKNIKYGVESNWDDAEILGVGTNRDITFAKKSHDTH